MYLHAYVWAFTHKPTMIMMVAVGKMVNERKWSRKGRLIFWINGIKNFGRKVL